MNFIGLIKRVYKVDRISIIKRDKKGYSRKQGPVRGEKEEQKPFAQKSLFFEPRARGNRGQNIRLVRAGDSARTRGFKENQAGSQKGKYKSDFRNRGFKFGAKPVQI